MLRFSLNLLAFRVPAVLEGIWSRRLTRTSRDEWKLLVWLPVVPLAAWAVVIAKDTSQDSTSHNLWPFELVAIACLCAALFGVVLVARRLASPARDLRVERERDRTT